MPPAEHNTAAPDSTLEPASSESFYTALAEIGGWLVRAVEPEALCEAVIEILERLVGAKFVMVVLRDPRDGHLHRLAPLGVPAGLEQVYPEEIPPALVREAFWAGDLQLETGLCERAGLEALRPVYAACGVNAAIAVPVPCFGEVRAALMVRAGGADYFSPRMVELLGRAATGIGLGLEAHERRTRLLAAVEAEARQHRAWRLLSEIAKLVTHAEDEPALLDAACTAIAHIGGYPLAWIGLFDAAATTLVVQAQHGFATAGTTGQRLGVNVGDATDLLARVLADAVPLRLVPKAGAPRPRASGAARTAALLALPIPLDHGVGGVCVLGAAQADAFGEIELKVFSELAAELGTGLRMQRAQAARLAAETALQANLQYFRAVLEQQRASVLVVAEDGRTRFVNEAFCQIHGIDRAPVELEGVPAACLGEWIAAGWLHPERELQRIRDIVARGEAVKGEEVEMADGRVYLRDFTPIRIAGVLHGHLWMQRDITWQKTNEARIRNLAFHDVVTGLPNRRLLFQHLERAREEALERRTLLAVGVFDLDRFKVINDTLGHEGGDQMLSEAATRVLGILRKTDVLARFGGDEFALLIPDLDSREQLDVISRCILQALRAPLALGGGEIGLSASIGWTLFPLDDADAEGLVRHADMAMYEAKQEGRDRGALYAPAMEQEQLRLQQMRERIAQALAHRRLRLLFQPIVYIDGLAGSPGVAGVEALIRLDDEAVGLVGPSLFQHVLDDPQLARPIGRFVLEEAVRCGRDWLAAGQPVPVSVNISTRHLLHPDFFADVEAAQDICPEVMDTGFGIEITETGPAMDHARAGAVIEECRRRGIRVSLDDFGTGTASLSHIQHLDIEHIKLDQSFVRDILANERNVAIAAGVITTARMLAKSVIAEGVESTEQGDLLASLGCHQLQGHLISPPLAAAAVPDWVARWMPPGSWNDKVNERLRLLARDGRAAG